MIRRWHWLPLLTSHHSHDVASDDFFFFFFAFVASANAAHADHPNVLFLAIDDLNDWVESLGGHPLAKTPNLDQRCVESFRFPSPEGATYPLPGA